ncbi:hypothetical protein GW758_01400 [Candidatus Falkowbacteria bacterium]|nr:hypothetical protein [Candidatus Falkowbacteria bacterium]
MCYTYLSSNLTSPLGARKMNEINKKSEMEKIEEFVAIFRDVVCVSHEKGLLSSEYLENINDESQEVSLFLERFFAEKSQHFDKLYFKKLADDLTIEALSGICPCVDYAKTVKYFSTSHWEADIISILGGHTSPTEEIKVEAYQAEKDMSIFQAFSKLSPDYNRAALNKSQIRWFCLKYRYFLQDEKNFLVFLLKNFHSPKNGDSKLIGSIVQADSHGLHISIVPESKIISVKDGINNYAHIFIVPNSA